MSKRNGKNKTRLSWLDEINQIDKRLKKKKVRENEEETSKLQIQNYSRVVLFLSSRPWDLPIGHIS